MSDVEIPPAPSAEAAQQVKCLVCGDSIQPGNLVGCATCDTPHHRDCFEYNGKCSVYACGGTTYILKWKAAGKFRLRRIRAGKADAAAPAKPALAAGPPGADSSAPPSHPARYRVQTALGENEIRIEASGLIRSLGIAVMSFGGALGATFSAGSGSSLGGCGGCDPLPLAAEGGEFFQVLFALIAIVLALFALWVVLSTVLPALVHAVGAVLYWCDNSYWTVDSERRLVNRGRIFGIPYWRRRWPAGRAERVVVGPVKPNGYNWLVVRFRGGRQVYLADDRKHATAGYDYSDLVRMGRRLAEALGAQFDTVQEQADLPDEPASE